MRHIYVYVHSATAGKGHDQARDKAGSRGGSGRHHSRHRRAGAGGKDGCVVK